VSHDQFNAVMHLCYQGNMGRDLQRLQ